MQGEPQEAPGTRDEPAPVRPDVEHALRRIRSHVPPTPLVFHPGLTSLLQRPVWLKLESLQITGSFKVRGAANRLLALSSSERRRGVVACSSGNHARAVAHMARRIGTDALLFVPDWVDPGKLEAMEAEGARVVRVEGGYDQAEIRATDAAHQEGRTLIHPFDDPEVVAGQGTLGLEILTDLPEDAPQGDVLVPLSGGGLAGGVGLALEGSPHRLVTVSAHRVAVMRESLARGRPTEIPERPTLASALSGGIGRPNRVTFPLLRRLPALHLEVGEAAVARGVAYAFRCLRLVVEGGGSVGLAALLRGDGTLTLPEPLRDRSGPLVIVFSGGNLDSRRLLELLEGR
jgi:threonine dehydratase